MPTKHYLVETDKGKFMVEVDEPANMQAQGGDTINGRDPNVPPSLIDRFKSSAIDVASHLAQPQSGLDLLGLVTGTSAPVAAQAAARTGPVVESVGRGISAVANASKRASPYLAGAEVLGHGGSLGGFAKGAAIEAAPYVADAAGKGVQATGRFLQRETPLLKFGAPAVNVERPAASVVQAAKDAPMAPYAVAIEEAKAAAPATSPASKVVGVTAVPAAAEKLNLSATETKEYLRLIKSGRPPQVAADLIKGQRAMAERLGLPTDKAVKIEQDYIRAHGRRQQ